MAEQNPVSQIVGQYRKGDSVPSWLLDQEPRGPQSAPSDIRFEVDCCIVETAAGYFLVPESDGAPFISAMNGQSCRIFAASRVVAMPLSLQVITPVEQGV